MGETRVNDQTMASGPSDDTQNNPKTTSLQLSASDYTTISIKQNNGNADSVSSELGDKGRDQTKTSKDAIQKRSSAKMGIQKGGAYEEKEPSLLISSNAINVPANSASDTTNSRTSNTLNQKSLTPSAKSNDAVRDRHAFTDSRTKGGNSVIDDDVSEISPNRSVYNQTTEDSQRLLDCDDKQSTEQSAVKRLINCSCGHYCICNKSKEILTTSMYAALNLCGWVEPRKDTEIKPKTSYVKRRPSPAVFQRLAREGKEKTYAFKHHRDTSNYMHDYRDEFTVGGAGDLSRVPPVMGRDIPDPYAMKPSNVCSLAGSIDFNTLLISNRIGLVTEVCSLNPSAIGLAGGKRFVEESNRQMSKRNYPNLSPVRHNNTPCSPEDDPSTPSTTVVNVNQFMEPHLPQIRVRPCSTPVSSLSHRNPNGGTKMLSSSTQFNGEIVGVKHRLPMATTCNMSALCKPSAGSEVYGELKTVSDTCRKTHSFRNPAKKIHVPPNMKPSSNTNNVDKVNMEETVCESSQRNQSNNGCRGCTRISSLLHGKMKLTKQNMKSKPPAYNQCKPMNEIPVNTYYRLQKLPIG
ncbi:uncharacterized protein LOC126824654 [Patella vulgata]|uniref:uncharacterized protein LOC126824654 n=1 Tax=Patella vulgata TaxID=6465 RepID=UPI00217FA178|nr:uncharacterized protein LOC126824654 [Patella vulgata]